MNRSETSKIGRAALLAAAGAAALVACGDGGPATGPGTGATGGSAAQGTAPRTGTASAPSNAPPAPGTGSKPADGKPADPHGGTRTGRAAQPLDLSLPDAPALTAPAARGLLTAAIAGLEKDAVLALAALDHLSRLGDVEAVRKAAAPFLAAGESTGGFDDPDYAGAALTALLRAGDADAAGRLLTLAEAYAADGEVGASVLAAAPLLPAAEAARMKGLLTAWSAQEDNFSPDETLQALAALRPTDAESLRVSADVARDAEQHALVRAAALGVLLSANDPQAAALGDAIAEDALESGTASDAIDGLGVKGLSEAIPYIRKLVEKAIAAEAAGPEIRSAAFALVDIRGAGAGTPEDITWLRSLLGKEDGVADSDVRAAMWALGDDAETGAAAAYLAEIAGGVRHGQDPSSGVDILTALARRGGAVKPPFDRIVSACAVVAPSSETRNADVTEQAAQMRLAAAFAFLASQK